jgi:hypothetical protein
VVAWSSFIQVESKILEKITVKSVGCREAFRRKTTPIFICAVALFALSVISFVAAFVLIGYIKPCAFNFKCLSSNPHSLQGVQTSDIIETDFIRPHLLGRLSPGTKGPVNRLANRALPFVDTPLHYPHSPVISFLSQFR